MKNVHMRRKFSNTRSASRGQLDQRIQDGIRSTPLGKKPTHVPIRSQLQTTSMSPVEWEEFKMKLMINVKEILHQDDLCPPDLINSEVDYFFSNLGLDDSYFHVTDVHTIANHILCIFSAKSISRLSNNAFAINVKSEDTDRAFYICNSTANLGEDDQTTPPSLAIERRIESKFLAEALAWEANFSNQALHHTASPAAPPPKFTAASRAGSIFTNLGLSRKQSSQTITKTKSAPEAVHSTYRVKCFRTKSHVSNAIQTYLWFFSVEKASYLVPREQIKTYGLDEVTTMNRIANEQFRDTASPETQELFQNLIDDASVKLGPAMTFVEDEAGTYRLVICYRSDTGRGFFSGLSNLIKQTPGLLVTAKEFEPFHGFNVVSLLISTTPSLLSPQWQSQLQDGVSVLYATTATSSTTFSRIMTPFHSAYSTSAAIFVFYFHAHVSTETQGEIDYLQKQLRGESKINKLHTMIRTQELTIWSESRIEGALSNNDNIVQLLQQHFDELLSPTANKDKAKQLEAEINKMIGTVEEEFEQEVLHACLKFNRLVKRTNLYRKSKSALLYEISPECLSGNRRYPELPFCILMIVGSDFRGFHVRFSDISRGGVRLVKSRSQVEWQKNAAELFFENYSLALTQQRKNKDIPEGGSKGVILTLAKSIDNTSAFKRYIDAVLDYLIPDPELEPNRSQDDDMIFIGPDENTADLMDWACEFARMRELKTWKAFTTGKSARLGGIPHDKFGMTTRGVHQYVLGALAKMGLKEEDITKCQTGGPDGDLGSNEILISKDKTIAIIDGSGVLYDPHGINHPELRRLATNREPVKFFNTKFLSSHGFLINSDDKNVQSLPDGTKVEDAVKFRNTFHLHPLFTADVFVPCGGRPAAVNMSNIATFEKLKDATGATVNRFKLIVEGANLFFTQDARLVLEGNGVVLFKDASANKGGVTSSSCEVLAALALTDIEHSEKMCLVPNKQLPEFYESYAIEVQNKIEYNAQREFDCIWMENQRTHKPMCDIGDELSRKINTLALSIRKSELLWSDVKLRNTTLALAVPTGLIDLVGGCDQLVKRVPDSYCRWIFASFLASHYIYSCGIATTEFTFMTFVEDFKAKGK
eukprot:c8885_g1_i1.p1 GENE.c8885_g1_i1~~c8885_g1_i1.p1  ORF type:complete len:1118 (+),score=309.80 c8885_g1_i1:50-3355(+)